jgi:hypothetical protein
MGPLGHLVIRVDLRDDLNKGLVDQKVLLQEDAACKKKTKIDIMITIFCDF